MLTFNSIPKVLTAPTHERYQSCLEGVPAEFHMFQNQHFKPWNEVYAKIPSNHLLLPPNHLPIEWDYDCVLIQNKCGQYQLLGQIAASLGIPTVVLEHTLPHNQEVAQNFNRMRGNVNVFISEYNRKAWGFEDDPNSVVIHHAVDPDFIPGEGKREKVVLSVVNDWRNRDWCCNFSGWTRIVQGQNIPVRVVGDTPGLSKPAKDKQELISHYQNAEVFLNTSTISPIPTALLEAMSCGCACVSTATCMIPEIIEHGVNGFISNDEATLTHYCKLLLENEDLARQVGEKARETILEKFGIMKFCQNWTYLFNEISNNK